MLQLEASLEWESPHGNTTSTNVQNIIEVDLTADTTSESPEVSFVAKEVRKTRQNEFRQAEHREDLLNLSKLLDRNLLAELTTENTWMDRLRRVIERKAQFRVNGTLHELVVEPDVSGGRLYRCRREIDSTRTTAPRCAKTDTPRSPRSGGNA